MDGNAQPAANLGDRAGARGRAADSQVVAELDSIGTTDLGRNGRLDVTHADFDHHAPVHDSCSRFRLVPDLALFHDSQSC